MGQELAVIPQREIAVALAALAAAGTVCQVVMVDGQLVLPSAAVPPAWRELRLRTPAGMMTLRRRDDAVALTVFGNADPALLAVRDRLAAALGAGAVTL